MPIGFLSPFLIMIYPCMDMYFNNIGEALFKDVVFITLIFIIITFFLIIIFRLFIKNLSYAVFLTAFILFIFLNFRQFYEFFVQFMWLSYMQFLVICFFIIGCVCIVLKKFNLTREIENINKFLTLVFSVLIMVSFIYALPKIISFNKVIKNVKSEKIESTTNYVDNNMDKPNFYWLIFDEYGGYENLKSLIDFENNDFYKMLQKNGFNVSYSSKNNSIYTHIVLASLVSMKENVLGVGVGDIKVSENIRADAHIVQLFINHGYEFNKITNDPVGKNLKISYSNNLEETNTETVYGMILANTVLYPINFNISDNYEKTIYNEMSYLYDSIKLKENGVFSFAHFSIPHHPFIFDRNCNKNPFDLYNNIDNTNIYLNQLLCVNKVIEKFIKKIIHEDPNSIVLIQSDHGWRLLRQRYAYFNDRKPTKEEYENMKSILNVLYYKGDKVDIEGLSGYDTLKMVVDKVLGEGKYE